MFLIGSKAIGLTNNGDTDYLIISDRNIRYCDENGNDILERTLSSIKDQLEFKSGQILTNYQLDYHFCPDFPIKYNILDYRKKLITVLKVHKIYYINSKYLTKAYYHLAYNTFILMNNSTKLTDEQLAICQKIHDQKMPIEYAKTLNKLIDELEE